MHLRKSYKIVLPLFLFAGVLLFSPATDIFAQESCGINDPLGTDCGQFTGLPADDITVVVARIISAILGILGILTVVYLLYGGFLIMTSGGDEGKVDKGKSIIKYTIIGLVIIFTAWVITRFVLVSLGKATGIF